MRGMTVLGLVAMVCSVATAAEPAHQKKLIEFGWDEPDTSFMREHVAEMEKTPFDGCVFHVYTVNQKGERVAFMWDAWSKTRFEDADLRQSAEELRNIPFKKFTHNFMRLNTAPADVDWFDDYSTIVHNVRVAAKAAHDGQCAGVLFDTEQYNSPLFDYRKQRDAKTKSWDDYAAQVRKRGKEVMEAFQEGYPDLTIFLTFGYSLPYVETMEQPQKVAQAHYGLLAPFLDGMLDAAKGKTRIVDGCELAYAYKDTSKFGKMYETMSKKVLPLVADHEKYQKHFSLGFGVWMDEDWRKHGWDTSDFGKNFYSPEDFEKTARTALETSDEYVWIYTEKPKWWSEKGPTDLPDAYEQALRRAAGK
jgi:hypothetical protein